jgi:hypothetical protein
MVAPRLDQQWLNLSNPELTSRVGNVVKICISVDIITAGSYRVVGSQAVVDDLQNRWAARALSTRGVSEGRRR